MRNRKRVAAELFLAGLTLLTGACVDFDDADEANSRGFASSAVSVSAGGVTVDAVATNAWSGGFNGAVRIANNSFPAPITSFAIVFRLAGSAAITGSAWNGNIAPPDGAGNRTATHPSWLPHGPIQVGQTWDVGFSASGSFAGSTIVGISINGQNIPLAGGGGPRPVYSTSGGRFFRDGTEVKLYGLNWFGMETSDRVLHGLWTGRQLAAFLADIRSKGFNALRLPLSPQTINSGFPISAAGPARGEDFAALNGRDGRTALEYTLGKARDAGLFVLLDFHTCNPAQLGGSLPGSPIACPGYSLNSWLNDMQDLAALSLTFTNVIGIDLTNEPHSLTWSAWVDLVDRAGRAILAINPNIAVWVEGVGNASNTGGFAANWGQNLHEAGAPLAGIPANRLVYSPHSYGPSVAVMDYFSAPNYPDNMPVVWDTLWGHLVAKGFTVVTGEFGGHYTTNRQENLNDRLWQDRFVDYLIAKGTTSFFYWAVNPNSGDTGGVYLDDWTTWNQDKLALLQRSID